MSIFAPRRNLKPYEYPELIQYTDAIRHSYWVHTEFNYTSDVQDYHAIPAHERSAIKRTMLAIAQIEVAVKNFWGDVYKHLPKPEIGSVGATFAESEVRHADAYAHLLELLGLNKDFEHITEVPAIKERMAYLDETLRLAKSQSNEDYVKSIVLFSLFVEHISLFSQFLIMLSFNKYRNKFKGISNAVEATSKEEQVHGMFGIELINIIKRENPTWFTPETEEELLESCRVAFEAESKIVDWILEEGELDFLSKAEILEFIKDRFNRSAVAIGFKAPFNLSDALLNPTSWFDDEVLTTKHVDFFYKRSINYNKRSVSITHADLF